MKTTEKDKKPLIIVTAGGSGGHVYPAESLAEELLKRGYEVELVTDSRGKDNYKGSLAQIPNHAVLAGALVGKSKLFKLQSLAKTCIGIVQSALLLLKRKPVCVVGFGGYASFPCAMAAILLGNDLVLHEQNSVMSRTNRFLSKYAALIAQSFRKVKYTPQDIKTVLTGMPVRQSIVALHEHKLPPVDAEHKFQILVMGGSQGAKVFGDVLPAAIARFSADQRKQIKIFQQCRADDVEAVKEAYKGLETEVILSPFFENMPEIYNGSHVIISRAGASSICEIAIVGLPSVLVPLPIAADDHQTSNAREIEDARAGIVIRQSDFTAVKLHQVLENLLQDRELLQMMSDSAKKIAVLNAAERFADAIEKEIITKKSGK